MSESNSGSVDSVKKRKLKEYTIEFKKECVDRASELGNMTLASREKGIPVSTLDVWIKKYSAKGLEGLSSKSTRPHHQPKKTSQWIIDKILSFKKEKPEAGASLTSDHFARNESVNLSARTIQKIFKKHSLPDGDAGYTEQSMRTKGDAGKQLEQTVEKEIGEWERFCRPNPNDMWQMDIMSFYIRDAHKVYLISALDDCSRMIVNWGLFRDQTADNVLEVLRGGLVKHGAPKEVLTDQGAQFKHWGGVTQFEKLLKKLNVSHVTARSHHPQTCGKIEAFHKTIHRELIDKDFFISQEQASQKISRFIEHYNYARPHSSLDGFTPSDRYFCVIDSVKKYLSDFKIPKNETEKNEGQIGIARESKLYLIGKVMGADVRIQELGGQLSIFVNNNLIKEINLVHSINKME
jgi:transposase InsO family protein